MQPDAASTLPCGLFHCVEVDLGGARPGGRRILHHQLGACVRHADEVLTAGEPMPVARAALRVLEATPLCQRRRPADAGTPTDALRGHCLLTEYCPAPPATCTVQIAREHLCQASVWPRSGLGLEAGYLPDRSSSAPMNVSSSLSYGCDCTTRCPLMPGGCPALEQPWPAPRLRRASSQQRSRNRAK